MVRAILDASQGQSAAWAVIEVFVSNQLVSANRRRAGRIALIFFPYPALAIFASTPPPLVSSEFATSSGKRLTEKRPIRLQARYTTFRPYRHRLIRWQQSRNYADLNSHWRAAGQTFGATPPALNRCSKFLLQYGPRTLLEIPNLSQTSPPFVRRQVGAVITPAVFTALRRSDALEYLAPGVYVE